MNVLHHNLGKHMKLVLNTMCSVIKEDYNKIDFTGSDDWFSKYAWKQKDSDNFEEWLADYLYMNDEARLEIMVYPKKNKQYCDNAANWFVIYYGWEII